MTPEQLREAAAVMLAAADGKQVQSRAAGSDMEWRNQHPTWNWYANEYRIKPEPRKMGVQLLKEKNGGQIYAFRVREVPGYTQYGQWIPVSDIVEIEVKDE